MNISRGKPVHVILFCRTLLVVLSVAVCAIAAEDFQTMLKKAEAGDAAAQHYLAWMYANGEGVTKSREEAAKWIRKAAEQGKAETQYMLGEAYANGYGVPQDDAEAVKWFRKAAERGAWGVVACVGTMYERGEVVLKDYVAAYAWYRLAAYSGVKGGSKSRETIAKEMTLEQIAEAQELSKELLKKIEANKAK